MATFFNQKIIDSLYMAGSVVTVFMLVFSNRLIRRFNIWKLMLWGIALEIIALLTLGFSHDPNIIKIAFIAHQAIPPLLGFNMDLFFEGTLETQKDTEKVRSFYLTFSNTAFVIAPLMVGLLINDGSFANVYLLSALFLSILWLLIKDVFKNVHPKKYRQKEFFASLRVFLKRKNLKNIFLVNFIL